MHQEQDYPALGPSPHPSEYPKSEKSRGKKYINW